jgi:hypothetical protein
MGAYVQQSISRITISMSGIWAEPHPVEIIVCLNNDMVLLTLPETIFTQTTSAKIQGTLPGNLFPIKDIKHFGLGVNGTDSSLTFSISALNGNIVIGYSDQNDDFDGSGQGGFYAQAISYQIKEITS